MGWFVRGNKLGESERKMWIGGRREGKGKCLSSLVAASVGKIQKRTIVMGTNKARRGGGSRIWVVRR